MSKLFQISKYFSISLRNDFYDAYLEIKEELKPEHRWFFFSFFSFDASYAPKDEIRINLAFLGQHVGFYYEFNPVQEVE